MNFFQSKLWKQINEKVYDKTTFQHKLFNQNYFGIIKEKNKFGLSLRWYQILWVTIPESPEKVQNTIQTLKRDLDNSMWDIFLQLGITNLLHPNFDTFKYKNKEFCNKMKKKRKNKEQQLKTKYNLQKSFKENMSLATIKIDLTQNKTDIMDSYKSSTRTSIRKWSKEWLIFQKAKNKQRDDFYDLWSKIADAKWFSIPTQKQYFNLKNYLIKENKWQLYLTTKNNQIVAWWVFLYPESDEAVYLYGATDRSFGNIWASYMLQHKTYLDLKDKGYKKCDLFGASPTWYKNHSLRWVTKFKRSFGGQKSEYFWNFDLIFKPKLYKTYRTRKKTKSWL